MTEVNIAPLLGLPSELIHHILAYLDLSDLLSISLVNRALHDHSSHDTLWQPFVQEQVPGYTVPKPANQTWRELFQQHHPYWFLAKRKIWFADIAHIGKLLVARYDYRINAIEAYVLSAERRQPTFQIWDYNPEAIIHTFSPRVQLDLNSPIVRLNAEAYERATGDAGHRLQREISMNVFHDLTRQSAGLYSRLLLTRPWPAAITSEGTPVWPPLTLPSEQRTRNDPPPSGFRQPSQKPALLSHMSTCTFRIRRWMEFSSRPHGVSMRIGEDINTFATLPAHSYTPTAQKPWQGIWCGDYAGHGCEFLVITQPDEADAKPLPERAEWAMRAREREGSVSSAGSWSTAPTDASTFSDNGSPSAGSSSHEHEEFEDANALEDSVATLQASFHTSQLPHQDDQPMHVTDEDSVYKGRIEAVKLTGDPNIPRGEYTFIAPDIGPGGLLRVATEEIFKGARIVKSVGHIAARGFRDDNYMTSQLILISHDRLAQYWETFGHVSFYERVDIDAFTRV
ncbi:hypothetical protein ACN47E_010216 [Coniothyrium glycines]